MNSGRLRPGAGDRFFSLRELGARSRFLARACRWLRRSRSRSRRPAAAARRNRRTREIPVPSSRCSAASIMEAQGVCHFSRTGARRRAWKLFSASASACAQRLLRRVAVLADAPSAAARRTARSRRRRWGPASAVAQRRGAVQHQRGMVAMGEGIFIGLGRIARQRQANPAAEAHAAGRDQRFQPFRQRGLIGGEILVDPPILDRARIWPTAGPSGTPAAITSRPVSGKRGLSQLSATDSSMRQCMALAPAARPPSPAAPGRWKRGRADSIEQLCAPRAPTDATAIFSPPRQRLPAARGRRWTSLQPLRHRARRLAIVRQQRRQPQQGVGRERNCRRRSRTSCSSRGSCSAHGSSSGQNAGRRHHPQHRRGIGTFQQAQHFLGDALAGQVAPALPWRRPRRARRRRPSRPCRTRHESGTGAGCADNPRRCGRRHRRQSAPGRRSDLPPRRA